MKSQREVFATYHLKDGGQVLGAHMLEICPSIAAGKPSLEIHPLSIEVGTVK